MTELLILNSYNGDNLIDNLHKLLIEELCNSTYTKLYDKSPVLKFINLDDLKELNNNHNQDAHDDRIIIVNLNDQLKSTYLHDLNSHLRLTDHLYLLNTPIAWGAYKSEYLGNVDFAFNYMPDQLLQLERIIGAAYYKEAPHLLYSIKKCLRASSEHLETVVVKYKIVKSHAKAVGVFLDRKLYHGAEYEKSYTTVIHQLAQFIARVAIEGRGICPCLREPKYQIYLFSMDRSTTVEHSKNDFDVAMDLKNLVSFLPNIHLVEEPFLPEDIPSLFKMLDYNICTTYESMILSQIYEVPFLTLYSHYDLRTEYLVKKLSIEDVSLFIDVDEANLYVPNEFDHKNLEKLWNKLSKNSSFRKNFIKNIKSCNNEINEKIKNFTTNFTNLLFYQERRLNTKENNYFKLLTDGKLDQISTDIAKHIIDIHIEPHEEERLDDKTQLVKNARDKILKDGINHLYTALNLPKNDKERTLLAEIISLRLTKKSKSSYNWGLSEQIFTDAYNLVESTKWILDDFYVKNEQNRIDISKVIENTVCPSQRKLDLSYYDQYSLRGVHRSGWPYVVSQLEHYHNREGVIFDSYGDRTFGWESEILSKTNRLPLTRPWIAVFHHTFNEEYSENNLSKVFANKHFLESLKFCRGFIVMSDYIKCKFEEKLVEICATNPPPVLKLYHPTEFIQSDRQFTWSNFMENEEKKVVQIGAWLRDTYAIYDLPNPRINKIKKSILKGKLMENYFPHQNYLEHIETAILNIDLQNHDLGATGVDGVPICRDIAGKAVNKYLTGLLRAVEAKQASVTMIDYLEKEEYDNLLSENLVFIKLIDVSACNTVIECIVRNTPILVNRLPAVEEYLGKSYPLYYETLEEASALLDDFKKIESGYIYLQRMDKEFLKINNFQQNLIDSDLYKNL